MESQYKCEGLTKIKMVLPVGKPRTWELIATSKGLSSWLGATTMGDIKVGGTVEVLKHGTKLMRFKVAYVGEKRSSFRLVRDDGTQVKFFLHGRMTTLTLEVYYARSPEGRKFQDSELPFWVFSLANLKSIALGGPSLIHSLSGRKAAQGFVD